MEHGDLSTRRAAALGEASFLHGWSPEDHQFGSIVSGVLLPGGGAAVLDAMSASLVLIDSKGRLSKVLGQRGNGPGEFAYPITVTLKEPDTLVVEDDNNRRLHYFQGGELAHDQPFSHQLMGLWHMLVGWEGDQAILTNYATPSPLPAEWFLDAFILHDPGSTAFDTVHTYRAARRLEGPLNPFRPSGKGAVTKGAVVSSWSNQPEVFRVPLDGSKPLLIRWSEEPGEVTDSLWRLHEAHQRDRFEGRNADQRIGSRRNVLERLPLIGELHGDDEGRTWVAEWSPDQAFPRYRVFGANGEWIGWVKVTSGLRILDIRDDRILAVLRDEFDVEAVAVLPVEWND